MKKRRKTRAKKPVSDLKLKIDYQMLYDQAQAEVTKLKAEMERMERRFEHTVPDIVTLLNTIAAREAEMATYKRRLAGLLDHEQKEHAQITGCPEDEYAVQLIRLCKQKIDEMKTWRLI